MNEPALLDFGNGEKIQYIYDATGVKVAKIVMQGSAIPATSSIYLGNFVYDLTGQLQYILIGEGRLVPETKGLRFEYYMKDHLGNTRATYAPAAPGVPQVAEYQHYYPFGMQIEDLCHISGLDLQNNYLYNGKELQVEYGVQWYDYGARFYDPQLGRFPCVDPIAEDFPYLSPFNYASNNPVSKVDLWGLQGAWFFEVGPMLQQYSVKHTGSRIPTVQDAVQYSDQPAKAAQIDAYTAAGMIGLAEVGGAVLEGVIPALAETKLGQAVIQFFKGNGDESAKATSNIIENAKQGKQFEGKVTQYLKDEGHINVAEQVTIKTNGTGTKFRTDQLSTNPNHQIAVTESKSSATAPLTKHQKIGHGDLLENGGVVVGNKGAAQGYPAGTKIPPTEVKVIRPEDF